MRYRMVLWLLWIPLGGCAYMDAQTQLVEQARKGVELVTAAQADHAALVDAYAKMQRDRLDAGFDADVREQPTLSADWVIEARKGYAAGLDAVSAWRIGQAEAQRINAANLNAVNAALEQLQALQRAATGWIGKPLETYHGND